MERSRSSWLLQGSMILESNILYSVDTLFLKQNVIQHPGWRVLSSVRLRG